MNDLFDFQTPRLQFAVMGNPVNHSKSPIIHEMFASQLDISLDYDRIQVDLGGFDQAVSHFAAHRGKGLNITVPFKVEAWKMGQRTGNHLSDRALLAESVNTLKFNEDGSVFGDNTDGVGIVRDIQQNLQCKLQQKRILVIGAGGAVRGVLDPLLQCNPVELLVINRTTAKAISLANHFESSGDHNIRGAGLDYVDGEFDIVINGSAASLGGKLPGISAQCIGNQTLAYDMMYAQEPTLFMKWALEEGAKQASDGLGMLVEQAAESFFIWHDQTPQSAPVISYLRKL